LGHQAGEIPGAAADVEHPVAGAGAACGGQLAEDTTSTAAEQDGSADVVGASMADEPATRAAVRIAVPRVRQFHRDETARARATRPRTTTRGDFDGHDDLRPGCAAIG
jgi:hypothetical protein